MNEPQFVISGIERRKVKKELSSLKRFINNFWYFHQLEKDMGSCMMTDKDAKIMFDKRSKEITQIQIKLNKRLP